MTRPAGDGADADGSAAGAAGPGRAGMRACAVRPGEPGLSRQPGPSGASPEPLMNDDCEIDRDSELHAYQQVAGKIAARIAAGRYTAKLPAERKLAEEFGVSYITLRHAMAILRQRGLIVSIHGRGTFVAACFRNDHDPCPGS